MGVHHVSWQSTASGLEDEYIHAAALSWLVGDEDAVVDGLVVFGGDVRGEEEKLCEFWDVKV